MQPSYELKLHPVDLSRHGTNPYGESLYRVVWADSRKSKVICNGKTHILGRYMHDEGAKGRWVLEKWAPAEVIVGMTRVQYEVFLSQFPNAAAEEYPERGDYELSRIFNEESGPFAAHLDEVALHRQLEFHDWRFRHTTMEDRKQSAVALEDAKEAAINQRFDALYTEAREENLCQD